MSTSDGVFTFLEAEELATQLVKELTRLKEQSDSYASARGTLADAGAEVARLASGLSEAVAGLEEVIRTLHSIGTPELLKELGTVRSDLASLRSTLGNAHSALEAHLKANRDSIEAELTSTREQLQVALNDGLSANRKESAKLARDVSSGLEAATATVNQLRILAYLSLGGVGALIAFMIVLWMR